MTQIPVNKDVLVWARNERGLSPAEAAIRLGISETQLHELEGGKRLPTVGELRTMAAKYRIGFSALLMPEPLPASTRLIVQDFRTQQSARERWHPDLLAEMDNLNVLIDALADLRDVEPTLFGSNLPRISLDKSPAQVAAEERKRIGLTFEQQSAWVSDADAFRRFRFIVEAQGVFVYVISASSVEDWRGLAIFDDRKITAVALNGDETEPAARSFSLMHEYAHILLRQSAISDQRSRASAEIFCNKFAAYFLMPPDEFRRVAAGLADGFQDNWTDAQIRKIAGIFHTSLSAAALHLENLELAPEGFYKTKLDEWRVRTRPTKKKGPVPYYEQIANRLGARHVDVVFNALDKGRINQIDAYELLDVQAANFPKLRSEIKERQARYAWES